MSNTVFTQSQRVQRCTLALDQAVYQACKRKRGSLGQIAEIYGVNYNTLALQVNPNRDCHTLAPDTIELVLEHTQSNLIMDAICAAHGNAGWYLLPDSNDTNSAMADIAELGKKFAELNAATLLAYQDNIIDIDEFDELQKVGHALLRQIKTVLFIAKTNMEQHNDR